MTGTGLLGLILLSMAWLFGVGGIAANYWVLRVSLRAKQGEQRPSSLGFVPAVVCSLAMFFTIPTLKGWGVEVSWPWLWIALPPVLDPYCLGFFLVMAFQKLRRLFG